MKKIFLGTLLCTILVTLFATKTMAATNEELIKYVTSDHKIAGESVGMTDENRVKAKRYLTENPVTDAQADAIIAKGNEIIELMNKVNIWDPSKLSKSDKEKFMAIAREAADVIGLKLVFHPHSVDVYDTNGKLIDNATLGNELIYTGNNINYVLVISSIATIALVAGIVAKKRLANAR